MAGFRTYFIACQRCNIQNSSICLRVYRYINNHIHISNMMWNIFTLATQYEYIQRIYSEMHVNIWTHIQQNTRRYTDECMNTYTAKYP